tara:strand:+ start:866 stop:1612 length:747 start_codon:yes stop_codon:yes gene_type:complete
MKILITGSSKGIGYNIAKTLFKEGHSLFLHCNKNKNNLREFLSSGRRNRVFAKDLSNQKGIELLFKETVRFFGFPDVLINNAGVAVPSFVDDSISGWNKSWETTLDINLKAPATLVRWFIKEKRKKKIISKFRIINIASRAAFMGETEEFISYACSKGGLVSLTKTIARSFGKSDNIVAFTVAPGFVKTDMAKDFIKKHGDGILKKGIVLDRLTEPKDISPIVSLMASGKIDHSTGSTFDVNGGSYLR